jgi:hypothetical protein
MKVHAEIVTNHCRLSDKIGRDSRKSHSAMNFKTSSTDQSLASLKQNLLLSGTFSAFVFQVKAHLLITHR